MNRTYYIGCALVDKEELLSRTLDKRKSRVYSIVFAERVGWGLLLNFFCVFGVSFWVCVNPLERKL